VLGHRFAAFDCRSVQELTQDTPWLLRRIVPGVDLPNNWARCLEIQIHTLTSALDLVTAEFITRRAYDRQIRRRLDRLAAMLTRQAPWARISGIAAGVGWQNPARPDRRC
jgi:hypothetical protein